MKKIAFFMNNLYGGGAEKVLQTILNNFDYKNYDVSLYSFSQDSLDKTVYTGAVKYKSIFSKSKGIIKKIKGYIFSHCSPGFSYRLLIKEKYDIVIAFTEGEVTKLVSGAPENHKKFAWVHIDLINNAWTDFLFSSTKAEAECYNKFAKIFCVSKDVKKAFIKKYEVSSDKVEFVQNPIDEKEIIKKSKERSDFLPSARPLFVTIGRLEDQKGYLRLVDALDDLNNYDFEIWILGEGSQRKQIEEKIYKNNLQQRIKLLGFVKNPYKYLALADAYVCSSYAEGFSTVATEAIILSKPVLTTSVAGMKELFAESECGVIVKNSNEDLFRMLKNTLEGKYDLELFKKNAHKRSKDFTLNKLMEGFYKAIEG